MGNVHRQTFGFPCDPGVTRAPVAFLRVWALAQRPGKRMVAPPEVITKIDL